MAEQSEKELKLERIDWEIEGLTEIGVDAMDKVSAGLSALQAFLPGLFARYKFVLTECNMYFNMSNNLMEEKQVLLKKIKELEQEIKELKENK